MKFHRNLSSNVLSYKNLSFMVGLLIIGMVIVSSCVTTPTPTTPPITTQPSVTTTTTTIKYTTTTSTTTTTQEPIPTTTTPPMIIPSAGQKTIHLVIVADTNDIGIGVSVAIDSKNMQRLIEDVVSQSRGNLFLNKIVFQGYAITQENMLGAIDSLYVRQEDAIIFLYAGHGFRYQTTPSKWPIMNTLNHPTDFNRVIQKIKSKNPRQFIALADCCNTIKETRIRELPAEPRVLYPYENINRLFLISKVKIAASGSKPGQSAAGEDINGGYFTNAFITNVRKALMSPEGNWTAVFENTIKDVQVKSYYEQEPQYEKYDE